MTISDTPHPHDPTKRKVVWNNQATVTGFVTDPEPYLILRLRNNQYLHLPLASHESINDWAMRSKVNISIIVEHLT